MEALRLWLLRRGPRQALISVVALSLVTAPMNTAHAADAKEPPGTISMHLTWPAERDATIEAVRTAKTIGAEAKPTVTLKAKYQSRIRRTDVGYEAEVGDDDFTIDGRAVDEEAVAVLQGLVLNGRVDFNGKLVEIFDIDSFRAQVRTLYRQKFQGKVPDEELERGIARLTTRETLQSVAAQTWNALAGYWVGSEFRAGVAQPKSLMIPLPGIDESYQLTGRATASDYEKCTPSLGAATCVRLRFSARAEPAAVKAAIERGIRSFGRTGPFSADDTVNIRFELELLTEPRTLTPYWAHWMQVLEVTTGRTGSVTTHTETTTFKFAYRERARRPN